VKIPRRWDQRWTAPAICIVLAAITFAVFGQTLGFDFVNFDDNVYVYQNGIVAAGLSLKGITWVFVHPECSLYHPLTMLSLMTDYQFHGFHAGGYHFTNVLLHAASAVLLFLVLREMTGALWRSAFVAAVFAIHPLRVESVAWIAERKDVLSGLFFMLTVGAYVRYVRKPNSPGRYLMVAVTFILALMCKPIVVTLPFVLLLLDYWPLRRFEGPESGEKNREYLRFSARLILEKIPLLLLAVAFSLVTTVAAGTEIATNAGIPIFSRIGNALISYAVYLRQMAWPSGLAVLYPFPRHGAPIFEIVLSIAVVAGISAMAWRTRRGQPWVVVGWLWYLGMLAPMIGIVQIGVFAHADRNTYLSQIGLYAALTWWVAERRFSRLAFAGMAAGVLALLLFCARNQTAHWENSETLWAETLAHTTDNEIAHVNLANVLLQDGILDEALNHYRVALRINPGDASAHLGLATVLRQMGKMEEAISHLQKAQQLKPNEPEIQNYLAWTLATCPQPSLRNGPRAVQLARQANAFTKGGNPIILRTLAAALAQAGQFREAQQTAQRALQLALARSNSVLAGQLQIELRLYQSGRPFSSGSNSGAPR